MSLSNRRTGLSIAFLVLVVLQLVLVNYYVSQVEGSRRRLLKIKKLAALALLMKHSKKKKFGVLPVPIPIPLPLELEAKSWPKQSWPAPSWPAPSWPSVPSWEPSWPSHDNWGAASSYQPSASYGPQPASYGADSYSAGPVNNYGGAPSGW
ncbi:uncharacterized protein LOC107371641 [Tetranychus urticae]|uniref:Uncharacterized protein n=1 Tax=Tetranychus urticae TaxID=32264 RepID=T1JX15_TETUR|nr:uncharacterized protein LOC107371641 [Tetranychus urticae]XP_025018411.1 uncharacterized protein LOC107371641 [Tetranychus urticae]